MEKTVSLQLLNTFGIDCQATNLIEIHSEDQLKEYVLSASRKKSPELILGGGSNVLFTQDFQGTILLNKMRGIEVVSEDHDSFVVKSAAGESWHQLVLFCVEHHMGGIENLSLIPGTVGAAPVQNIGAYGVELKDVFESLDAIDLSSGEKIQLHAAQCHFAYRNSIFKNALKGKYMITAVCLRLSKKPVFKTSYGAIEEELNKSGDAISIKSISDAVCRIRRSKLPDPAEIGNAGSFFKNPEIGMEQYQALLAKYTDMVAYPTSLSKQMKVAAGWLIERCGWKGKRFGQVGVHPKQALVLVNYGGGTGKEVLDLSQRIVDSVMDTFGILLEREVQIL